MLNYQKKVHVWDCFNAHNKKRGIAKNVVKAKINAHTYKLPFYYTANFL